jgi:hypothetical protein
MKLFALILVLIVCSLHLSVGKQTSALDRDKIMMHVIISIIKDPEYLTLDAMQQLNVINNVCSILEIYFESREKKIEKQAE